MQQASVLILRVALGLTLLSSTANGANGAAEPAADAPRVEESIYIPYEKLWQVFEKEGRGVFLPYEEFRALWEDAERGRRRPAQPEAPVDALINEVSGRVEVGSDVVTVFAEATIELLSKGWHEVPIRLGDVAITEALVDERPARLVRTEGQGYRLLLHHQEEEPRVAKLHLTFAKSFTKSPGRNSVAFQPPPSPVSRWDIRIPEPGVKVDIQPLLAATDVAADADGDETRVLAFVGSAPQVSLQWTPRAEGAKGLQALASVKAEHRLWIEEGVTRSQVHMIYEISRTELSRLSLEAPADYKVVNVFDANVREWSVARRAAGQTISVELFEPRKGRQPLVVELERFADEAQIAAPLVRAVDAGRQQGFVDVKLGAGLRAEATTHTGLLQMDARGLPRDVGRGLWDFSYRYAALPFALELKVEKIQPRLLVDSLVEAHVDPESLTLDYVARYDVQRAGVFALEIRIPDGFEIQHVRGTSIGKTPGVQVERHQVGEAEDGMRSLAVSLLRRAEGPVGLAVSLRRPLREPDLLTPTGKAVALAIPIPRARGTQVERETGHLVVYGPESLRINPVQSDGLRPVPYAEAIGGMPVQRRPGRQRPALSFAYGVEDASLDLAAERRAPQVTVRQLLIARIEPGVVKYDATLFYDVLYSGVKSLRLDVPADKERQLRITTPGIRHAVIADPEPPAAVGMIAWRLEGETEAMGAVAVALRWEEPIPELAVGKSLSHQITRLRPRNVDRAWGQIVLAKAEAIDVAPAEGRVGLRAIDPRQDLMPGAAVTDAARAFEFHGDWEMAVQATRYEPKDVKSTSIERGLVRMVLTRSDTTSVQALYRMRSARQRLAIRLPNDVQFDTQPLRLDGRAQPLEQGAPGEFFVPLVAQPQDTPFLLELRYVVKGAGRKLRGPEFPDEPAVQHVYLSAFMPDDLTYLGSIGPWTDELSWTFRGFNSWPRGNRGSDALLRWVTADLGVNVDELDNFATDGQPLLFSTLRPPAGDDGILRIVAVRGWLLQTLLLALIIGGGLALLRLALARRAIIAAAAVAAVVLLAVFTPAVAYAVINKGTVAAGLLVLMLWGLWWLLVTVPRSPDWQEFRRRARHGGSGKDDENDESDTRDEEPSGDDGGEPAEDGTDKGGSDA